MAVSGHSREGTRTLKLLHKSKAPCEAAQVLPLLCLELGEEVRGFSQALRHLTTLIPRWAEGQPRNDTTEEGTGPTRCGRLMGPWAYQRLASLSSGPIPSITPVSKLEDTHSLSTEGTQLPKGHALTMTDRQTLQHDPPT